LQPAPPLELELLELEELLELLELEELDELLELELLLLASPTVKLELPEL
jgi:hypothetical protein